MPEFYDGEGGNYSIRAQPYLDAIARGIRDDPVARAFLFEGTDFAQAYAGAKPLWQQQWQARDPKNANKAPFWASYCCCACRSCDCGISESGAIEIDALFFLQNAEGKTLAVHIEMKRDRENLSPGQAEGYRPRAACYRDEGRERKGVLPHNDFIVILFCGTGTDIASAKQHFDRVILHDEARKIFYRYPGT